MKQATKTTSSSAVAETGVVPAECQHEMCNTIYVNCC